MSSYYPSFNYLGINSRDKRLIVSHFDADGNESETFLGMEPVYTESADGSRRLDYGARYNNVAVFRITVIKEDGGDFSVKEVREYLKWLTGAKKNSSLDLCENFVEEFVCDGLTNNFQFTNTCNHLVRVYVNNILLDNNQWVFDEINNSIQLAEIPSSRTVIRVAYSRIKYSFICRVTNAWQQKLDARTIGIVLEFTSVSPWAYSAKQIVTTSVDGSTTLTINNETDDLYSFTSMNTIFSNTTGEQLMIANNSIGDITKITNISANEIITISDNMMIVSNKPNRIFGNDFNFIFPQLCAGENQLVVEGVGDITFEYVYAIKIGDCAMDINVISDPICSDTGELLLDTLDWNRISGTPTTLQGYGLTNVYSKVEVDALVAGIEIDENELASMLTEELN